MKLPTIAVTTLFCASVAFAQDATPAASPEAKKSVSTEERYKKYDKDKDGSVSLEEFTQSSKNDPAKLEKTTATFKKRDKDNDEKMSLEEFYPKKAGKEGAPGKEAE